MIPDLAQEQRIHNPFPQFHRIAVLPFFNQSSEPTVDGEQVAKLYYTELQQIPGFEVLPVGVVKQYILATQSDPRGAVDFQSMARDLNVDAIVAGSITEFSPYYPPRMGLAVRWYAANPAFHEIPPGYGLPWGTSKEEYIPDDLVFEAEFALAREQLKTQTPEITLPAGSVRPAQSSVRLAQHEELPPPAKSPQMKPTEAPSAETEAAETGSSETGPSETGSGSSGEVPRELTDAQTEKSGIDPPGAIPLPQPNLPENWPDPRGFVPPPPSRSRPVGIPHTGPVLSHVRVYDGHDSDLTSALAHYYYFRDDARFGGWQAYLQRSEDFMRFCCYMHISEMLAARGGAGKTRVVWRWPIGRYER